MPSSENTPLSQETFLWDPRSSDGVFPSLCSTECIRRLSTTLSCSLDLRLPFMTSQAGDSAANLSSRDSKSVIFDTKFTDNSRNFYTFSAFTFFLRFLFQFKVGNGRATFAALQTWFSFYIYLQKINNSQNLTNYTSLYNRPDLQTQNYLRNIAGGCGNRRSRKFHGWL